MLEPSPAEIARRAEVMAAIFERVRNNQAVKLPDFDPAAGNQVGAEPNPYDGTISGIRYQFEGEDDLLHLIVMSDSPSQARDAAGWLFSGVPPALLWFKPGTSEQHFYLGHDDLIKYWAG